RAGRAGRRVGAEVLVFEERNSGRSRAAEIGLARRVRADTAAIAVRAAEHRVDRSDVGRIESVVAIAPILPAERADRQVELHLVVELSVTAEDFHLAAARGIPGNSDTGR